MAVTSIEKTSTAAETTAPTSSYPEKIIAENPSQGSLRRLDSQIAVADSKSESDDDLSYLPENEREIIRRQIDIPDINLKFSGLYRFATVNDLLLIAIGSFCSIVGGALLPFMTILYGLVVSAALIASQ
jgi:ATP-binding cassette subfamily B (MDR/TAP) protein 1